MTVASRLVNTGMRQLAHQAETLVPGRLGLCPINTQRITACTNAPIYYAVFQAEQARNASLMRSLPQFKEMVPVTAPATAFFSEGEQVFKSLAGERKAAYQQLCMALGANALMVAPPKPSMVLVTAPATAFFSEGEQVFKSLAGERKAAYQQLYMAPGANALMVAPKPSWMDSGSLSPEVCENLTQLYSRRVSPDLVEEYDASNEQRPDESSSSVPSEAMKDHRFLMSPDGPPPYYGVTLEQSAAQFWEFVKNRCRNLRMQCIRVLTRQQLKLSVLGLLWSL
jgi:hypothetical protein